MQQRRTRARISITASLNEALITRCLPNDTADSMKWLAPIATS
jgi:hypothetical protein